MSVATSLGSIEGLLTDCSVNPTTDLSGRAMWNVSVLPSTAITWPLTIEACAEARNAHMSAISDGFTKRGIDWLSTYSRRTTSGGTPRWTASASMTRPMRGPSTAPGATTFARTPKGPSSTASDLVKPITAHLAAAYGERMP